MARARGNGEKGGSQPAVRTAEEPGQTLNVDLCFVPATHEAEQKLPAVSGSSGRLIVEQLKEEREEKDWPGRVFEEESRDYTEAMLAHLRRRRPVLDELKPQFVAEGNIFLYESHLGESLGIERAYINDAGKRYLYLASYPE